MKPGTGLFNRNFVLLWQGQLVSQLGSQAFSIAMMYWVKSTTESATLMGLVMMASMIPMVVLGPFGGTFADRVSRKRIIVFCDLGNGVATLSLAAVVFLRPDATGMIVGWLFGVAVVSGTLQSFFRPAITAAVPNLVPEDRVASANSLTQGSVEISTLIGQGIGGVLYKVLGAPMLFLIDGLSFVLSAVSESFIAIPQVIPDAKSSWSDTAREFNRDLREGVSYVWRNAGLRDLLFTASLINFFAMPFIVLLPFHVEDVLGVGPDWFGYLLAAFGGGGVIGSVLAGALRLSHRARMVTMLASLFVLSLSIGLFGMQTNPPAALLVLLCGGVFHGAFNIWLMTIIQTSTPDQYRGRVFGVLHTIVLGLAPLSMAVTGVVADAVDRDTRLIFVACGVVLTAVTLFASLDRALRNYLESRPETERDMKAR